MVRRWKTLLVVMGLAVVLGAGEVLAYQCTAESSCGSCTATGNVSVTCSSSDDRASWAAVDEQGGSRVTTATAIECLKEKTHLS